MTVATAVDRRAVEAYASAVARHLRHLPRAQRRRLVADLRAHLLELPDGDLHELLGSPGAYAAELLRSSGLPQAHGFRAWLRRIPLWVRIVAPLVAGLAVAATIGGIWLSGYAPLVAGFSGFAPGIRADSAFGERANVVVNYQHDARYVFGFSLRNDGSLPLEITDFPLVGYARGPLVVEDVLVDPPNRYGDPNAPRFRPFTLQPGEDRGISFRGVLAHCDIWSQGASVVYESVKVDYRVLGIGKTADIALDQPIAVQMPATGTPQCPYPNPPREGPLNGNDNQLLFVLHGGGSMNVQLIASRAPTGDLQHADWTPTRACGDTPVDGSTTVPVDIVASQWPVESAMTGGLPIDLRFAVANGRVLVAAAGASHRCRIANSVHVDTLDGGDIAVIPGIVEVPTGTCGAQQIEISALEQGYWKSAGTARLDIPCPAGG